MLPTCGCVTVDDNDEFGQLISLEGMEGLHQVIDALLPGPDMGEDDELDITRAAPLPIKEMFPDFMKQFVSSCTRHNEAVPIAVAANALLRLSALIGPMVYLPIGDEKRLLNEFMLMVGPSGLGKGASNHGPKRIFNRVEDFLNLNLDNQFQAGKSDGINKYPSLRVHTGGLSSGEGLAAALDDGTGEGKTYPVSDKRALVFESEFANSMSMAQRSGNILMMVLRNAYDGVAIEPLTKRDKIRVSDPYICLMAHITAKELSQHDQFSTLANNGMLNRFLILWQQPVKDVPFPEPIEQDTVDQLAQSLADRILFARGGSHETHWRKVRKVARPMTLSKEARALWEKEYGRLLNRADCETVKILTRRHRLHAMILASLFALLDFRFEIQQQDINSALAWCEYSRQSVVYIFNALAEQNAAQKLQAMSKQVLRAITLLNKKNKQCTATDLYNWFQRKVKKQCLHASLELLLNNIPPLIVQSKVIRGRGRPVFLYDLSSASKSYLSESP